MSISELILDTKHDELCCRGIDVGNFLGRSDLCLLPLLRGSCFYELHKLSVSLLALDQMENNTVLSFAFQNPLLYQNLPWAQIKSSGHWPGGIWRCWILPIWKVVTLGGFMGRDRRLHPAYRRPGAYHDLSWGEVTA